MCVRAKYSNLSCRTFHSLKFDLQRDHIPKRIFCHDLTPKVHPGDLTKIPFDMFHIYCSFVRMQNCEGDLVIFFSYCTILIFDLWP